ncbi:serine hydrolase [Pelotomaculum terephthalicicum JT]|uniref:serine hydrolase n=1 Tax=Pelotomaculum TaxID=191373 RepID=UPI0009D068B6|nr:MULTISPECIES: serine hydrolase [Pelotomaculum]MCG9968883.1 serine hydrolase [Pelotomaculum terephthalicicum JT]OPX87449.1 MAG: putative penicillin-binding protein PbpX [Pelotomaculum sp. PtaB.Bin117]OPY61586.1 MAG: putative penicillin-binding protein PbpX [Pelotomaculum sp. PtaU1.Bin065]
MFRRTFCLNNNRFTVIKPRKRQDPDYHDFDPESAVAADSPRDILFKPYINVPQNQLDAAILAEMNSKKIVGVAAAFIRDNRVVWANGYGWSDLEKEKLVTPDTIFRIASISKTITATALMQLWECGLFNLDDDISIYLGYMVRNPKYPSAKITFRMLLTHTSSILDFGGYEQALGSPQPPLLRDLLVPGGKAYSEKTWGDFLPGTQFVYSNFGFGIIGALVEMISGKRFNDYTIRHIFWPLGMDAGYNAADIVNFHKIAVLYKTSGGGKFYPACDYFQTGERPARKEYKLPLGNYYIGPAGAVRASVLDLSKFMIAHMNGGLYGGVRILQKHTADLMHQMHWYGYGMEGFFRYIGLSFHITDALAERRLTGHAGEACGLVSDMYFDCDEKIGVIFMTNGGYYEFLSSGYTDIEEAVINTLFKTFAGPPGSTIRVITTILNDNKILVNGRIIFYPVLPDLGMEDLYVPAITIADALETTIEFDKEIDMLILTKGVTVIRAKIGDARLEANHNTIALSSQIYLKHGFVMLPLIIVSKLLDACVYCNPVMNEINITLRP